MGDSFTKACQQKLIKKVHEILSTDADAVNSINALLELLRDDLHISGVRIRQRISRPFSLRIMYECMDSRLEKRINETISYTEEMWNEITSEYQKGVYAYYNDGKTDPLPGICWNPMPKRILQFPHFSDGIFLGTLDLFDFKSIRRFKKAELDAAATVSALLFQKLSQLERESVLQIAENDSDYITGLNRYETFIENLERAIPTSTQGDDAILILYTDIHHFKLINESYGYRKGDELLRRYAMKIRSGKPHIAACRVYSDNFIIAYPINGNDTTKILGEITDFQTDLSKELRTYCPDCHIRICSGAYIIENEHIDAATAVSYANMARKRSKEQKGRRCVLFSPDMLKDLKWHAYLNDQLPRAIKQRDLVVYYQPKISCNSGHLFGAEALIRWRKEDGSFIYPDQFIPEFESNGNIIAVDYYVYEEVFRYLRNRLDMGLPVVPISMNVSRIHLDSDDLIKQVHTLLDRYHIPTKYIEFELTENIYMQNMEPAKHFINACNDMGISVSMDDFGSGYSSLNMISSIQIDVLKIDKIFMKNNILSDNDKIVLNSVIEMAKRLHMMVLCEGVETEEQADFLKEAGCDVIQGYYFGKPMCEEDFDHFVNKDFAVRRDLDMVNASN